MTLFNLSIPFPAQLRVWDVFMLLGDCPPEPSRIATATATSPTATSATYEFPQREGGEDLPPKGLDILHATSAALIHALRDVLIDSDFENAMKALTAWIPVRDEDLLMKVARAEWRRHQQGKGGGSGSLGRLWEREKGKGGEEKAKEKDKGKETDKVALGKEKEREGKEKEKKSGMGRLWERGLGREKEKEHEKA